MFFSVVRWLYLWLIGLIFIESLYLRPGAVMDMVALSSSMMVGGAGYQDFDWWGCFVELDIGEPSRRAVTDTVLRRWFRKMYLKRSIRAVGLRSISA